MDSLLPIDISASALSVERLRMAVIASNLANVQTTRTPEGGPYKRKSLVVRAEPLPGFQESLKQEMAKSGAVAVGSDSLIGEHLRGVTPVGVVDDTREPLLVHAPWHPDADANGNVKMPNISVMEEMVNMIATSRAYEANLAVVKETRNMVNQALEIGK
jgi:flagellar basal-body rod protein FlgC